MQSYDESEDLEEESEDDFDNTEFKPNTDFYDQSLVIQNYKNFEELLSSPKLERAIREYSQRSESSGLPDGSTYDELLISPVGEPLAKAIHRLSQAAITAWEEWISGNDVDGSRLEKDIVEAFFDENELAYYTRIKRLKLAEDLRFKKEEYRYQTRLIEESVWRTDYSSPEPVVNRFYSSFKKITNEFGEVQLEDRCKGHAEVRKIPGIQVSNVEPFSYSPSHDERLKNIVLSDHETSVWRKEVNADREDNYLPNVTPKDDPDYITPSDISSRNFVIYPPVSRTYNNVFVIKYTRNNKSFIRRIYPKLRKDYTSLSSIKYILDQKNFKYDSISIDQRSVKFEIDLRVTYGENLVPDPNSYKKVDPESKLGMKLLQMLNEQPHLFKEYSWSYDEVDENGNKQTTKKLAVAYEVSSRDDFGSRIYWVYVDDKTVLLNSLVKEVSENEKIKIAVNSRKIAPQIIYKDLCLFTKLDPVYIQKKRRNPYIATLRIGEGYCYFSKDEDRVIYFDDVVARFGAMLIDKGYKLLKVDTEPFDSRVKLYHYLHESVLTKAQRKTIFRNLIGDQND